jgi:signal transduction histidine kinase
MQLRPLQTDLAELTRRVGGMYSMRQAESRCLVLTREAAVGGCPLIADSLRLEQVLKNLIDNAVKYSPRGGTIRVRLEADYEGWLLTVRDEGLGLPPGSEDRIFQPFGRAANAATSRIQGMGLGLYIIRQIVHGHTVRLWAEGAGEGQGANSICGCRAFRLPLRWPSRWAPAWLERYMLSHRDTRGQVQKTDK